MRSIFLQMLGSLLAPPSLFHIVAHNIILLSGVMHSYGMYYYYIIFYHFLLIVCSPATCEELFNLWHAKAQNVIERSFGGNQAMVQDLDYSTRVFQVLRFNLVKVEIRELRPEVIAESEEVLVHYRSRTNVRRRLSTEILAQVDRRTREHL